LIEAARCKVWVVKVLIQDKTTGLFVAHESQWTFVLREARDFGMSTYAATVARNIRLKEFLVIFYFPELGYRLVAFDSQADNLLKCV
jgi:hypothetical protein